MAKGFIQKVFQGAKQSIPYIACMLSEISMVPIYSGMPHYLECLREYEKSGFSVSGIYPITRKPNLAVIEMDCMLVNGTA